MVIAQWGWGYGSVVEHVLGVHKVLASTPSTPIKKRKKLKTNKIKFIFQKRKTEDPGQMIQTQEMRDCNSWEDGGRGGGRPSGAVEAPTGMATGAGWRGLGEKSAQGSVELTGYLMGRSY